VLIWFIFPRFGIFCQENLATLTHTSAIEISGKKAEIGEPETKARADLSRQDNRLKARERPTVEMFYIFTSASGQECFLWVF
jgi:hypothetical protein